MWRAVGSTVVTSAVIGSVWYHPAVFGSTWLKLAYPNTDKSSVKPGPMVYPVTTVSQLAASAILYEVLQHLGVKTARDAVKAGGIMSALLALYMLPHYLFANVSRKLYLIDRGFDITLIMCNSVLMTYVSSKFA